MDYVQKVSHCNYARWALLTNSSSRVYNLLRAVIQEATLLFYNTVQSLMIALHLYNAVQCEH
jgi:hypothetical protein